MAIETPHRLSRIAEFWLIADGQQYSLSQVAPDFVVLRKPVVMRSGPATLVIDVEGQQEQRGIQVLPVDSNAATYLPITQV